MTTHCIFGETSPGQQDHTIAVVMWGCELSSQSHCWKWWWFHPILVCSVLLLRVYCEGTMLQSSVEKKPYNPQSTIQFHHLFSPLFVRLAECRVPGAGHTGVSVACHSGSTHYFSFSNIHYYARILSFAIFLICNRDACSDLVKQNRPCLVLGGWCRLTNGCLFYS